jgi:hypothetical protein
MRVRLLVALAFLMTPAAGWPQVPAGGQFRVNTSTTDGQSLPWLAADAAGNFVVTWESRAGDGDESGVFAQRFDAAGRPRGAEFQVNTYTTGHQSGAVVASDAAGNFVVVWTSAVQDAGGPGIFAQRFDARGARRGAEFRVNTFTPYTQTYAGVAGNASGQFMVAWSSAGQDGDSWGIYAQRFDASGAPLQSEFRVNSTTLFSQNHPAVAMDADGRVVVAWEQFLGDSLDYGVLAQRYAADGQPQGPNFVVNAYAPGHQVDPSVAFTTAGEFVIVWKSDTSDGSGDGVVARRFAANAAPLTGDIVVNTYTGGRQAAGVVAADAAGNVVVTWDSRHDGDGAGAFAQRFGSTLARRGGEFQVNSYTSGSQYRPRLAVDGAGNVLVAWTGSGQGDLNGVFAQRFGGIVPAALAVDTASTSTSDGNRVLEPGESVDLRPSWRNVNGSAQAFDGAASQFTGPPAAGVAYTLSDGAALYGAVADGATVQCSDCYQAGVSSGGVRPSLHWDATLGEQLTPDALGQVKPWSVHVGASFADVPRTSPYYRFVETLLHARVTGGCTATAYCGGSAVTREQMAVFTLEAREGAGYRPPPCGPAPLFADVPPTSFFCAWIEELARRGVAGGCGNGNFCPGAPVTREQMPVFVLRLLDPTLVPPACATPLFADVPAGSPFCRWIEELARRGVVTGCGGGNYCPGSAVLRDQMAVFISVTYTLTLYGP